MVRRKFCLLFAVVVFCSVISSSPVQADEGAEIISAHPMALYPNAVPRESNEPFALLTKDPLAKVQQFFAGAKQPGDRITPVENENEKGFQVTYNKTIEGKEQSVMELECYSQKPTNMVNDALGELMVLAKQGKHTEAEYKAMEKKYRNLDQAYFRQVDNGKGGTVSEGKKIYQQTADQAHQKPDVEMSDKERSDGKAQAKELKKQMQALKAKGDIAGMMALAQQKGRPYSQSKMTQNAMAEMNKDTWDLWVACLEDLSKAAYWTRLQYSGAALPQQ